MLYIFLYSQWRKVQSWEIDLHWLYMYIVIISLKVNHTVMLSTLGDSSYRFGATYVGAKQMGPAEVRCSEANTITSVGGLCSLRVWNVIINTTLFLFSFSQSWWETWTTVAAWTPKSSTRSLTEFDPNWLFRQGNNPLFCLFPWYKQRFNCSAPSSYHDPCDNGNMTFSVSQQPYTFALS